MAENTLLTRIQLKYDTFANWESSSIILKKGEVAIAEVPSETTGSKLMPPAIGIKVGDGNAYLIDKPFLDTIYWEHVNDTDIHITAEEREFWNNKVRCYYSLVDDETVVFTTE